MTALWEHWCLGSARLSSVCPLCSPLQWAGCLHGAGADRSQLSMPCRLLTALPGR